MKLLIHHGDEALTVFYPTKVSTINFVKDKKIIEVVLDDGRKFVYVNATEERAEKLIVDWVSCLEEV